MSHCNQPNTCHVSPHLVNFVEFIPDRLYLTWTQLDLDQYNSASCDCHYFTIDKTLVYQHFFADFGPLNMSHLYRFICFLGAKFKDPHLENKKLILYSNTDHDKRANAAYLISHYMMIVHQLDPDIAYRPLVGISPPLMPYRDAGSGPATYFLTVHDCLKGLHKAMTLGLFSFDTFDLEEYEKHEKVEFGDFNWISPKFIAFASPCDNPRSIFTASALADYFANHGVVTVVRLNNKLYDKTAFTRRGIEHIEMYFPDGSCPTDDILHQFLTLVESRNGAIAVHCKAGLGRTGSLIAAYFMKHYKFTSSEVIAFLRILRPGSVVGPQQNWLHAKQHELHGLTNVSLASNRPVSRLSSSPERIAPTIPPPNNGMGAIPNQPRKTHDPKDPYSVATSVNRYQQTFNNSDNQRWDAPNVVGRAAFQSSINHVYGNDTSQKWSNTTNIPEAKMTAPSNLVVNDRLSSSRSQTRSQTGR